MRTMNKMRILLSGHLPPPMGGIGAYYQNLLGSTLSQQVELDFVITSSQQRNLSTSGKATLGNLFSAVKDVGRFFQAVRRHRPQVTHIAVAFGLSFIKHSAMVLMARALGSKVLLHPHCSLVMLYTDRPNWWKRYFKQVIRMTHGVVALSQEWQQLQQIVPGCPVYELPNALNLAPYESIAAQRLASSQRPTAAQRLAETNQTDTPVRFLYLGYLGKAKGSFDLLSAAKIALRQNANIAVDLVGSELNPGERVLLEAQVAADGSGRAVTIHPPAYEEQKHAFFRAADVLVYPSYHEGMPMAMLEAMACALPVVATRVGGLPDLVTDGENGLLVEAGNPEQLASAMLKIAADPAMRARMQRKSYRRMVDQYDIEQHVARLVEIYHQTIIPQPITAHST